MSFSLKCYKCCVYEALERICRAWQVCEVIAKLCEVSGCYAVMLTRLVFILVFTRRKYKQNTLVMARTS